MKVGALSRRRTLCALGVLAASVPVRQAHAQFFCICSYSAAGWGRNVPGGFSPRHMTLADNSSGIPQIVTRIKKQFSISTDIDVFIAYGIGNAMAAMDSGRRILVADPEFLKVIEEKSNTKWGPIQVLAHEIGHHIAGQSNHPLQDELNADYWSGWALNRLKSDRGAATAAILSTGTSQDTSTHPNKFLRARTIERGWDDAAAGAMDKRYCMSC